MLRQTARKSSTGGATREVTLVRRSGGASTRLRRRTHARPLEGAGETNGQKTGSGRRREGIRIWKADREKGSEAERGKKRGIKRTETGTEMRGVTGGGDK